MTEGNPNRSSPMPSIDQPSIIELLSAGREERFADRHLGAAAADLAAMVAAVGYGSVDELNTALGMARTFQHVHFEPSMTALATKSCRYTPPSTTKPQPTMAS